uniref:Secreted protein n=1 Tax=Steinernema glaseri TaxID=37863 RepID=A0A1I7ZRT7_9BILA
MWRGYLRCNLLALTIAARPKLTKEEPKINTIRDGTCGKVRTGGRGFEGGGGLEGEELCPGALGGGGAGCACGGPLLGINVNASHVIAKTEANDRFSRALSISRALSNLLRRRGCDARGDGIPCATACASGNWERTLEPKEYNV